MKFRSSIIAFVCVSILSGCEPSDNTPTDPNAFRFIGRIYDFSGNQAAFAVGDSAGLFASAPLSVVNRRGEYSSSGYMVFNPSVYPVEGASGSADVVAYIPYDKCHAGTDMIFAAKTDQSEEKSFRTSCLFRAAAAVNPGDISSAVHLDFHPVSAHLSLYTSNLSGKKITAVKVGGVTGTLSVNLLTGTIESSGAKSEYSAFADADSAGVYRLNLAPQTARPTVKVEFEDGTARNFALENDVTLISGKITSNAGKPLIIENEEPVDPEDFSKCTVPGVYATVKGDITGLLLYKAGSDQYATASRATARMFRLQNLSESWMFKLYTSSRDLVEGSSVTATVETAGLDTVFPGDYSCTVLKVSDSKAWLTCDAIQVGFIIVID